MANLTGSTTAVFFVRLSAAVDGIVDVDWSTRDGTAIAGKDYEAASGTVSFLPGETEKAIDVVVYGQDDVTADGKKFYIELKPPANAVLTDALAECVITVADEDGVLVTSLVIAQGKRGLKGNPGLSAYEQAVLMGYTGTVEQWMDEIGDASQAAERAESFASQAAESAVVAGQKADEAVDAVGSTKQYVDGALASQSAYLDSELANQTQTVNSALSDLSTAANKFYSTLAAANADIANIAVDQPVTIGERTNGGLWYKVTAEATSLTKSPYDPVELAKADATTKVTAAMGTALTSTSDLNTLAAGNYYITTANLTTILDAGTAVSLGYPVDTPRGSAAKISVVRVGASSYSVQTIEFTNFGTRYTRQGAVGGSFNAWVAPPVLPALQFGSIALADNLNNFVTAGQWGIEAATVATNSTAGDKGYPADLTAAAAHFTVSVTSAGNAVQLLTHLNKTRKRVIKVSNKSIVENWTPVGATSIYATEAEGRVSVGNGEVFWVYPNSSNTLEDLTLYKRIDASTSEVVFVQVNLNNYLINEGASWE